MALSRILTGFVRSRFPDSQPVPLSASETGFSRPITRLIGRYAS
jgi:hypothetical protein